MLRKTTLLSGAVALAMLGGCVLHGEMSGGAYYDSDAPELAYVSPGVYVVADYGQPVFYDAGYYWFYNDGVWLRSDVYDGGWARVSYVPVRIRRIHRPRTYIHYRVHGRAYRPARGGGVIVVRDHRHPARVEERDHRGPPGRVEVRDHRGPPGRVQVRDHRAPPGRVQVRDHRAQRGHVQVRDHRAAGHVHERDHRRGGHKRDHRH